MRPFLGLCAWLAPLSVLTAAEAGSETKDGHPDFDGIWQAANTANWKLEARLLEHKCVPFADKLPYSGLPGLDARTLGQ